MGMGAGSQETVLAGAVPVSDGATLTPSEMESGGALWEALAASSAFSATMGCAAKNAHLREGLLLTGAVASGLWSNWEAIDGTVTPLVRIVAGAAPATGCCKGLTVADADEGSLFGAENSFMLAWKRWRASSSECAAAKILCGKSESEKCCGITFLRIKSHRWAAVAARWGGVRAKGGPATDFLCDEA